MYNEVDPNSILTKQRVCIPKQWLISKATQGHDGKTSLDLISNSPFDLQQASTNWKDNQLVYGQ